VGGLEGDEPEVLAMATLTLSDDLGALAPERSIDLKSRLLAYERELITAALAESRGNQRRAANKLGILPTTLHEKMKRLGLRADAFQPGGVQAETETGAVGGAQDPAPAGEASF
jgi:DNA-binding NtrC family response regulator